MIDESSQDMENQIKKLRASRQKKLEEFKTTDEDDNDEQQPTTQKVDDGVMGVLLYQCIVAVIIAIIYVLFMTFNQPIANEMKNTIMDKSANDFSFKDKVYDTVGNAITYLNEIEPIDIVDISGKNPSSATSSDTSSNTSSTTVSQQPKAEKQENKENNENTGTGGELNPVKENEMPANATFAPVVFTGRITFPIAKNYIKTSDFGFRDHPSKGVAEFHTGVDIGAPKSTPVMAAANGTVVKSEKGVSLGNYIMIDHSNGFFTVYGHCDKLIAKVGAKIREGEIIAKVGSTGDSTGNHLHFAMIKDGLYFDPTYVFKDKLNVEV